MTGTHKTFPTAKGVYRCRLHCSDLEVRLTWSGIPAYPGAAQCWRWGLMKVRVDAWEGPL